MKYLVAVVLALGVAYVCAEPPAEYGAPSSGYGAPSSGYGAPSSGGYGGGGGGGGGWGQEASSNNGGGGGGWGQESSGGGGGGWSDSGSSSGGFLAALRALKPRFRYVNLRIPIPILPRIRLGLGAKINAHASIQRPQEQGWGEQKQQGWGEPEQKGW